ncbi:MAG TPA: TraR/DksA C4-type zinc finger protein [Chitinophagaceae bacterium]|nr:TraR/DksA C4-type zinc finger protein [Chitinophagaceae bacterium]
MATKKPVAKKAAPAKKIAKPAARSKSVPKKAVKHASVSLGKTSKPVSKSSGKAVKSAVKSTKAAHAVQHKPVKKHADKKSVKAAAKSNHGGKTVEVKHAVKASIAKPAKSEPIKEVKVPKTSVKTSVPYQPGYTPLEKRADSSKTNEPLVRYSDAELAEFKTLINKKLEAAKKELAYLQGLITRKDDMGGDETDNRYMTMEDGSMSMEREQLSQMASRQITYIDHLEKALIRIENKTYGICRVTGKLIDKARLRAVPHATLSLEAKLGLVKPSNEQ